MTEPAKLAIRDLHKSFGALRVTQGVNVEVRMGELHALIGPNGAGKTTLFASIAGFHKPDAGTVTFRGQDITGRPVHQIARQGMVRTFQITQPFAKLTVLENIAVGSHQHHARRSDALAHARVIAQRVGIPSAMLDQPAAELTVAGRKRLELARTLATEPKLLLLDEVMAGLNPQEILDIIAIIRQIRDGGVTILLIEHVMHAVMSLSEHIHVLSYGKIIAQGAPSEIVSNRDVVEAYLGRGAADHMAAVQVQGAHHA